MIFDIEVVWDSGNDWTIYIRLYSFFYDNVRYLLTPEFAILYLLQAFSLATENGPTIRVHIGLKCIKGGIYSKDRLRRTVLFQD